MMALSWLFISGCVIAVPVCALTAVSIYLISVRKKYSHIPGPPRDSFFLGHIPTFQKYLKEGKFFSEMAIEFIRKYGHVVKIELAERIIVITADPQSIRELMITGNHTKSKAAYEKLGFLFGERFIGKGLVVETDKKVWVWRRALMNPCFQKSYIKGLESAFNTEIDLLINKLAGLADGKTQVSMLEEFNHLTLDVIGKIGFGMQMNNVENRTEPSEYTKAIKLALGGVSAFVRDPFIKFKYSKWKYLADVKKAMRTLRVLSKQSFDERKKQIERGDYTPDDILNFLVKMKLENPELDGEVILDDITTFFLAGQETSANLLSFALICLWQNKDVLERLKAEVSDIVGDKHYISVEDTNKMEYLDMVIKETLRLYPPAANTFRENKTDIEIQGYKIPAGTGIMISTFVSSRLEEFFPEPLKFDPERFNPAENRIPSYTYFPFTLGPRTCIGKDFGVIEAKMILSKIVQRFNFEMDPNQSFDIEESATLKPKGGAFCSFTLCDS
ncbi:cholesterol 24-hydroxylase-like isoform X3 [Mytilus edulis]|uniref:cholesterol 24-hydroxylase-like isoform X3 n=1 Tax=Mytilus edulis TaxID=6550 RepID=UPI0039F0F15B